MSVEVQNAIKESICPKVLMQNKKIGEISDASINKSGPEGNEFVYVDISSVDRELKKITSPKTLETSEAPSRAKQHLKEGDVLVSMTRPNLNAVALVPSSLSGAIASTGFYVLRSSAVEPKFIYYLVQSKDFIEKMCEKVQGALYPAVRPRDIDSYSFDLPVNREEQRRLVEKIEELFSELDSGIASLKTAQQQLSIYRQSLLKHAFEGKLTEQWRKDNASKLETPEQLLARIQQEREARYQQQLEEWQKAVKEWEAKGKEGRSPRKPAKLKKTEPAIEQDYAVPSTWAIGELQSVAYESVLGKMLDKQKNIGTDRFYLGNINVRWGYFDLENLKQMKIEDTEVQRYSLEHGDLVICEGGEPGRCAVWKNQEQEMFIQKALHRVRFTESYLPIFSYYYLTYAVPLERVVKHFTGTTIKHLTGRGLGKVQLPVCSLEEQQEIINQLEEKLSIVEQNEKEIETALAKAELLRQSILKKAFSGQLSQQAEKGIN